MKGKFHGGQALAALVTLLMLFSATLGLWSLLEAKVYDSRFQQKGAEAPPESIVIIGVDDESLHQVGRWPWARSIHGELLDRLEQAKVVCIDISFASDSQEEEDQALAEAIGRHGRVVLAAHLSLEQEGDYINQVLRLPVDPLLMETFSIGFANFPTEEDNIVRRALPMTLFDGYPLPSLALATAMAGEGLDPSELDWQEDGLIVAGSLALPPFHGQGPLIHFRGPAETYETIPYYQVLNGDYPPEYFADKWVLVGPVSPLFKDEFNTPYTQSNMALKGALPTPGVELHATALDAYLNQGYFFKAPLWVNLMSLVFLGFSAYVVSSGRRPWQGLLFLIFLALLWYFFTGVLWSQMNLWVDFVAPAMTALLVYLAATAYNHFFVEQERKKVQGLFGRYVSDKVVDELLKNPDKVALGGQRQIVTVFFSDIRGFTSYSEGKTPEEVVSRLNEYFTVMTSIVFKHGGTLDKYLGDGMMAVFGAPIPQEDHAERALRASLEMCRALEELNRTWEARGEKPFGIGIGLNSGPVLSGNIGSPERMEYTVIGEDVNLSARLESMNKEKGTQIIFSERTLRYMQLPALEDLKIVELGDVAVRGMVQPVKIYTVR
ncbi:CHASE2 domain-containing protein [Heliorestis acidaminivorans]|uniref:CHASE2 domain-containing protein n=1 Tax=Heliorestis acidaminivorans TaxID=553427 RepID=UPI0014783D73|nr:adenylate/guanylate cyclase domain-containing protein [Heliorestis acidaminivorans]